MASVSFYHDGAKILCPGQVVPDFMRRAVRDHGIDPRELAAIASRLITDESARETFEDLTGLEVVRHD